MSRRDLHNNIQAKLLLAPDQITADTQSAWFDMTGYLGVEIIVCMGDAANSLAESPATGWDIEIEHADADTDGTVDTSSAADVSESAYLLVGANSLVAAPDSNGKVADIRADTEEDTLYRVGYVGPKPFVRVNLNAQGTPGATDFVVLALGIPLQTPADDVSGDINL